jgi:indolepyruvate ferredoxin oxidoreductase beta subunit
MNPILALNIALVGVGGQGTLVAGKLLGTVARLLGLDVKVSEEHGMSQRGGSVITYVRISDQVHSPLIEAGEADFILAFEELEALRWACLLKAGGALLINTLRTPPATVSTGAASYPADINGELDQKARGQSRVLALDAQQLAEQAGSYKAANVVLIGALARLTSIDPAIFHQAIDQVFPEKLRAVNHQAFQNGSDIIRYKCEF